jgi:hypothetical protein
MLPEENFPREKTESPIFQAEQPFVNLSSLPVEKKELPEVWETIVRIRWSKLDRHAF